MSFIISKALPSEAEEMLAYLRIIGAETDNLSFGPEGLPATVEEEQEYLNTRFNSNDAVVLVASGKGRIVGTASFTRSPRPRLSHRGEISISVLQSEWGKGIGTRLMDEIISFARDIAGVQIISLEVRSDNARAIRLYEKFGFYKTGTFPGMLKINGELIDFDLMTLQFPENE